MGALKSALTAIFNANTYTSSTSGIASKKIPVTESNGLPSGQIGMSDLASVLGVNTFSIVAVGPVGTTLYPYGYGMHVRIWRGNASYKLELFFSTRNVMYMAILNYNDEITSPSQWQRIGGAQ